MCDWPPIDWLVTFGQRLASDVVLSLRRDTVVTWDLITELFRLLGTPVKMTMIIPVLGAALQWLWREFQWPPWASGCGIVLGIVLLALHVPDRVRSLTKAPQLEEVSVEFTRFRRQYLVVYFLVMFADWLQGTHMYSLYESYGMNISALFLTGFLSSALLGNIVGPVVDKYGRCKACIVFCVLEVIINVLENFPSMTLLLVGRVLGGITTSILFSAFESWMVTEHRTRGFSEVEIAKTFAIASEGNGLLAVLAGIAAQVSADYVGEIGPFRLAVVVTLIAMLFILSWEENYGSHESKDDNQSCPQAASAWTMPVYALGMCYSLFEGAMYVFVFLWYPTLFVVVPDSLLPSGLVFSCFMLCIAIGGKIFDLIGRLVSEELLAVILCLLSASAFVIPVVSVKFEYILGGFLLFETCVGAFSPCSGTLRNRYFPSDRLSTVLSTFRLPTNVLVVTGTGGSNYLDREQLFLFCSLVMVVAATAGVTLLVATNRTRTKAKTA